MPPHDSQKPSWTLQDLQNSGTWTVSNFKFSAQFWFESVPRKARTMSLSLSETAMNPGELVRKRCHFIARDLYHGHQRRRRPSIQMLSHILLFPHLDNCLLERWDSCYQSTSPDHLSNWYCLANTQQLQIGKKSEVCPVSLDLCLSVLYSRQLKRRNRRPS